MRLTTLIYRVNAYLLFWKNENKLLRFLVGCVTITSGSARVVNVTLTQPVDPNAVPIKPESEVYLYPTAIVMSFQ